MKKTLFACTALCGAAFVAANAAAETPEFLESRSQGPASTEYVNQDQERLSPTFRETPLLNIKLAGVMRVDATLIDQDLRGTRPGGAIFDTRRDFSVLAGGTADNGVSYGFEIDVGTGRGKMFISNLYGRVDLGDAKSATEALSINGGDAMVGTGHYARAGNKLVNHGSLSGARVVTYRGQGGTIRYTSPSYSGFTVAGSYTEESDTDGIDGVPFGTTPGSEDIFSVAGQYTSTYGEYTSVLYAGCEWSNENSRVRRVGVGVMAGIGGDAVAEHDQELCSFGAKTSGANAGFAIGYGWAYHDMPGDYDNDRQWIDIGAYFDFGVWQFSTGTVYLLDAENHDRHGEVFIFSGSFNYDMAPGLAIQGGVSHHIIDDADFSADNFSGNAIGLADNEATTLTLSTQVSF